MSEQIIDGAYKLIKPIGKGGMATVYLAEVDISKVNYTLLYAYTQVSGENHAERVEKAEELAYELKGKELEWKTIRNLLEAQKIPVPPSKVALKLGHEGVSSGRFDDEWKYLICLNNPHVVKVYGGGFANGRPYYAMELMPGIVSQKEILENFTLNEKIRVVFMAGKGLSYLHKRGIVHRDVKPDNFITIKNSRGQMITKVTDLGLAKDTSSEMGMTGSAAVLGTPYFMAPEQMASARDIDHRADIYSLGASLYEFMTGKKPFHQKSSIVEILKTAVDREVPIAPEMHVDGLPKELAGIIKCAMAFDAKDRYQSMDHFLKDLKTFTESNKDQMQLSLSFTQDMKMDSKAPSTYLFESVDREKKKVKKENVGSKEAGKARLTRAEGKGRVRKREVKSSRPSMLVLILLGVLLVGLGVFGYVNRDSLIGGKQVEEVVDDGADSEKKISEGEKIVLDKMWDLQVVAKDIILDEGQLTSHDNTQKISGTVYICGDDKWEVYLNDSKVASFDGSRWQRTIVQNLSLGIGDRLTAKVMNTQNAHGFSLLWKSDNGRYEIVTNSEKWITYMPSNENEWWRPLKELGKTTNERTNTGTVQIIRDTVGTGGVMMESIWPTVHNFPYIKYDITTLNAGFFKVFANDPGAVKTSIFVNSGQKIRIKAKGEVTLAKNRTKQYPYKNASGIVGRNVERMGETVNLASLVIVIGSKLYQGGDNVEFISETSGEIELNIVNSGGYNNNDGFFEVAVGIQDR